MVCLRMNLLHLVMENNDIDMLKAVGIGVAMGNSNNDVKAAADVVCESVDDDGVYHYLVENGIISQQ